MNFLKPNYNRLILIILFFMISIIFVEGYLISIYVEQNQEKSKEYNEVFDIPEEEVFFKIKNRDYIVNVNDCFNKAGEYARHLLKKGYNAKVIIVKMDHLDEDYHALVEIMDGAKRYYADLTSGYFGRKRIFFKFITYVDEYYLFHHKEFLSVFDNYHIEEEISYQFW